MSSWELALWDYNAGHTVSGAATSLALRPYAVGAQRAAVGAPECLASRGLCKARAALESLQCKTFSRGVLVLRIRTLPRSKHG